MRECLAAGAALAAAEGGALAAAGSGAPTAAEDAALGAGTGRALAAAEGGDLGAGAPPGEQVFEVVVLGATPAGITAAVAAARLGARVALLERTRHIGGLPANGLGATDIATRGATTGLFLEFVRRVRRHYVDTYGAGSQQVKDCSDGYHFEPHVAERVLESLLDAESRVTLRRMRQLDARRGNVRKEGSRLAAVTVTNRDNGDRETYRAQVFIDATYEGDLAAAAGAPFRIGREGKRDHGEPFAGRVYRPWGFGPLGEGSTEEGDEGVQAYNYRLCLTDRPGNRVAPSKPRRYRREDYASLVEDVRSGYLPHFTPRPGADIGVVNPVRLPNGKVDANNHHRSFVSTDLPEENWPYPTATWAWRDRFARRLRDYTLGLLWFCQNDPELPEAFREEARAWGLARDEYPDNGHFPRQLYVREARRIEGEYLFTALDAMAPEEVPHAYDIMAGKRPPGRGLRAPLHADSITASHYAIDSHAIRKREPNRVHLDGFLGLGAITRPYQVPYGVIVPKRVEGLLVPVACSATHLGYGTLRMEPCWMALGQAAGTAAWLSLRSGTPLRRLPVRELQRALVAQGQTLIFLQDVTPDHPHFAALQLLGCRGLFPGLRAEPDAPMDDAAAQDWSRRLGLSETPEVTPGMTRGEFLAKALERLDG